MSLKKWPPAIILIKPNTKPETTLAQRNIIFLVIKYRIIIENPTEASPETKEQLLPQASVISYQG